MKKRMLIMKPKLYRTKGSALYGVEAFFLKGRYTHNFAALSVCPGVEAFFLKGRYTLV